MAYRVLFIEPPKHYWFVMGDYLPPPFSLLALAAYVERELPEVEIEIMDCQAEGSSWDDIEKRVESFSPSLVASSAFTCNAYACVRAAEIAKTVDENIITVMGGSHFSSVAEESLVDFPEIDIIVRGEGEETLVQLIKAFKEEKKYSDILSISYRHGNKIVHSPKRPLFENLDMLPYPAYHLVEDNLKKYHFRMMSPKNKRYMILEGARGCIYKCYFCSQWKHWGARWRTKSPKRIAAEMEHLYNEFGGDYLWLTDDNFEYKKRAGELWKELKPRKFIEDISWFLQARTDDITKNPELVSKLRDVNNTWILLGVENDSPERLKEFKKGTKAEDAYNAVKILKKNDIFTQAMLVIGSRKDTKESIERLKHFSLELDAGLLIYTALTPFPGTEVYYDAYQNGWIEDKNYAHYDMVHAIMPTETLTRKEVQGEIYECYKAAYGSVSKGIAGMFSKNELKKRVYRHMAGKFVLTKLRKLV